MSPRISTGYPFPSNTRGIEESGTFFEGLANHTNYGATFLSPTHISAIFYWPSYRAKTLGAHLSASESRLSATHHHHRALAHRRPSWVAVRNALELSPRVDWHCNSGWLGKCLFSTPEKMFHGALAGVIRCASPDLFTKPALPRRNCVCVRL